MGAVIIKGRPKHHGVVVQTLEPGSYLGSEESIIYVRTDGKYDILSNWRRCPHTEVLFIG